jgi:DNA polymerase-1
MAKWLLVDGFNMAYRCFFAIPELTRKDGFPTNAIHGWVKTLWRLEDQEQPHATIVFWDLGGAQDRLAIHPEYKAQREEMPEALDKQIEPMKELTRAMGMHGIEQDGVESDDLLAAQARYLAAAGDDVLIVSADKDFAQVVDERVRMLLPPAPGNPKGGWREVDAGGVMEKFGVPPAKIAELLALMGDTVDNIPGIAGVGPKTAAKWLIEHGGLEGVIAAAAGGALKPDRFREVVASAGDRLRMNLRLTTLNTGLPSLGLKRGEPDVGRVAALLESFEMMNSAADARKRYSQRELF